MSSKAQPGHPGYALLVLMLMVTLILISLTVALPNIYQQGQREKEEELIFRGNEYARAIALFNRQFHRFPTSIDELLKQTNGMRFLRHAYPDPMSRSGKWRLIHANAGGVLLDSKTQKPPGASAGTGATPGGNLQGNPQQNALDETQGNAPFGGAGPTRFGSEGGSEMKGGFIAGVASSSHRESIRVWNGHSHYDEWEFLGIMISPLAVPPAQGAVPGQPSVPPATPTMPQPSGQPTGIPQ